MLAYFEMFDRDADRLADARKRVNVLPLGSGALAGAPYPLDREWVARELGFDAISANSMDAVSDRDYAVEFLAAAATCMMHCSRLAEEIVLWTSQEFGYLQLGRQWVTGSSIMPQKRNPDFAEIARGKTGRVYGSLVGLLTTLKGLPLTYNRDLQEDKEGLFDAVDTLEATLDAMRGMLSDCTVNAERMREAAEDSALLATDMADYLVGKGVPFREAHAAVSALCELAAERGVAVTALPLDDMRARCRRSMRVCASSTRSPARRRATCPAARRLSAFARRSPRRRRGWRRLRLASFPRRRESSVCGRRAWSGHDVKGRGDCHSERSRRRSRGISRGTLARSLTSRGEEIVIPSEPEA